MGLGWQNPTAVVLPGSASHRPASLSGCAPSRACLVVVVRARELRRPVSSLSSALESCVVPSTQNGRCLCVLCWSAILILKTLSTPILRLGCPMPTLLETTLVGPKYNTARVHQSCWRRALSVSDAIFFYVWNQYVRTRGVSFFHGTERGRWMQGGEGGACVCQVCVIF
jgi:hypothetical protein